MKNTFLRSSVILIKSRSEALGLWLWCSIVSALIVGRGFPPIVPSFLAFTSMFFIALAVYIYNDIADRVADQYNEFKNDRPLVSGDVSVSDAKKLVYIASIVGLGVSLYNGFMSFLFSCFYFTVFMLYSYPRTHLKKRFLVKEAVISYGMIMVSLSVTYALIGAFSSRVLVGFVLFSVFAFCAMPTGFDSTDVEADRIQGVISMASVLSIRQRMTLSMAGMLVVMAMTPFVYLFFGYNVIFPISMAVFGVSFLGLMFPLMRGINPSAYEVDRSVIMKAKKIILSSIIVICICVILGSLDLNALNIKFFYN